MQGYAGGSVTAALGQVLNHQPRMRKLTLEQKKTLGIGRAKRVRRGRRREKLQRERGERSARAA